MYYLNLLTCRDFEYPSRGFIVCVYILQRALCTSSRSGKMAIIKKKKKVAGRKTRKKFTLHQKFMAIQWKTRDNMSPKEIRAKLKKNLISLLLLEP